MTRFLGQTVGILDRMSTDLKALPVPAGDEKTLSEMFAAVDKANATLKSMGDPAVMADRARFRAAEKEVDVATAELDIRFSAYGFGDCGYDE